MNIQVFISIQAIIDENINSTLATRQIKLSVPVYEFDHEPETKYRVDGLPNVSESVANGIYMAARDALATEMLRRAELMAKEQSPS